MKVRVCYTVEASDELRRALNKRYGRPGLATRYEIRKWLEHNGTTDIETVLSEDDGEGE